MKKKHLLILLGIGSALLFGAFPAFAADSLATATNAVGHFSVQAKILTVIAAIYGLLQGLKKVMPISGALAVFWNLVFAVLGVLVTVQPDSLFSLQTLQLVFTAAAGAAGIHGTIRSFKSDDSNQGVSVGGAGAVSSLLLVSALLLVPVGCGPKQIHPGAINAVDSGTADALLDAQTTLCGLTPAGATECTGGLNADAQKLTPDRQQKVIPFLEKATRSYNAAQAAYKTVHATATPSADQQKKLQDAVTQLIGDVAAAVRAFQQGK